MQRLATRGPAETVGLDADDLYPRGPAGATSCWRSSRRSPASRSWCWRRMPAPEGPGPLVTALTGKLDGQAARAGHDRSGQPVEGAARRDRVGRFGNTRTNERVEIPAACPKLAGNARTPRPRRVRCSSRPSSPQSGDPEIPARPRGHTEGTANFATAADAARSPLAERLFALPGFPASFSAATSSP